jgi:hypothetical protein
MEDLFAVMYVHFETLFLQQQQKTSQRGKPGIHVNGTQRGTILFM